MAVAALASAEPIQMTGDDDGLIDLESDPEEADGSIVPEEEQRNDNLDIGEVDNVLRHLARRSPKIKKTLKKLKKLKKLKALKKFKKLKLKKLKKLPALKKFKKLKKLKKPKKLKKLPKLLAAGTLSAPLVGIPLAAGGAGGLLGGAVASALPAGFSGLGTGITAAGTTGALGAAGLGTGLQFANLAAPTVGGLTNPGAVQGG